MTIDSIRQTLVLHVLPPLAEKLKVKKNKTDRFVERESSLLAVLFLMESFLVVDC
jgi:hypothetical protein